jgi:hypothetical protein
MKIGNVLDLRNFLTNASACHNAAGVLEKRPAIKNENQETK